MMQVLRTTWKALLLSVVIWSVLNWNPAEAATSPGEYDGQFWRALRSAVSASSREPQDADFLSEHQLAQLRRSGGGEWAVWTRVEDSGVPVAYLGSPATGEARRVGGGIGIDFDPAVNDRGDYVFATADKNFAESELILNGRRIGNQGGLYKTAAITNTQVAAHFLHKDKNFLFIRDLETGKERYRAVNLFITSIAVRPGGGYAVEGVPTAAPGSDVLLIGADGAVEDRRSAEGGCFLSTEMDHGVAGIRCINDVVESLAFLANRELTQHDPGLAMACGNNDRGRISWNVAPKLRGLIEHRELLPPSFPLRTVVARAASCLLSSVSETEGHIGWTTTRYSLGGGRLSLMVNNATIIDSLLLAVREELIEKEVGDKIVDLAREMYRYYEPQYDHAHDLYRFPKGIDFWADGVIAPFNMQNAFGGALLNLHKLTDDEKYRHRALALARSFRREWIGTHYPAWRYWLHSFYDGWTEQDQISNNTPARDAWIDPPMEDLSHAATNVDFILRTFDESPGDPFVRVDVDGLGETLARSRSGGLYGRFISSLDKDQPLSTRYMPSGSWWAVAEPSVLPDIAGGLPAVLPYFDDTRLRSYLIAWASSGFQP